MSLNASNRSRANVTTAANSNSAPRPTQPKLMPVEFNGSSYLSYHIRDFERLNLPKYFESNSLKELSGNSLNEVQSSIKNNLTNPELGLAFLYLDNKGIKFLKEQFKNHAQVEENQSKVLSLVQSPFVKKLANLVLPQVRQNLNSHPNSSLCGHRNVPDFHIDQLLFICIATLDGPSTFVLLPKDFIEISEKEEFKVFQAKKMYLRKPDVMNKFLKICGDIYKNLNDDNNERLTKKIHGYFAEYLTNQTLLQTIEGKLALLKKAKNFYSQLEEIKKALPKNAITIMRGGSKTYPHLDEAIKNLPPIIHRSPQYTISSMQEGKHLKRRCLLVPI